MFGNVLGVGVGVEIFWFVGFVDGGVGGCCYCFCGVVLCIVLF